jgi:serine/threonine protein kinase
METVANQRAGSPPDRDDPAAQHDSSSAPRDGVATETAADARTTIAGRYAVDLQTPPDGAGIAVTYRGRDLRSRDPVVVKTLRLEYRSDPEMRARFRREARLLQFLSHPNVIRALTFAEERGAPWLVLESVHGRSLRDIIDREAPLPPEAVVPILRGLAAGLDHLHARGLVHLDVRPENAVVTPDGEVKLVDFGLAQTADTSQEPADGATPDTVAYLAPEQVCGEPVSPATDVYALGCVVYEMLTGRPPFPAAAAPAERNAAIRVRLDQMPAPLTATSEGVALPAWVDDVVLGALERDPRQRYGSAGSFAAVFHSGVEGDVDVETGRPRQRVEPPRRRTIPVNEPGIAMKGAPRLATRRGEAEPGTNTPETDVVDATYAPLAATSSLARTSSFGSRARGLDLPALSRRLWQALILAAILNVVLIAALVATQGEIPGIWSGPTPIGPGVSVQVAGTGLVARQGPNNASAIVADLPAGGSVRISGEAVLGEDGLWWPIEVQTPEGQVSGYVPESWVQAP